MRRPVRTNSLHSVNPIEQKNFMERNTDRPFVGKRPIRRIGLLSPTSGNLGNAAMQTAMIANIRERIPDVELLGITLNPEETRRRFGIPAFPLAGSSRPNYILFNSGNSATQLHESPMLQRIKQWAKQIPLLGRLLRVIRMCGQELAHIVSAARVVRKLDRVIIPGGGALDDFWGGPWGHPWALLKWSVLSRAYGVPLWFVSIGKCSLERPLSRFFLRIALRLAEYRSYRDNESKVAVQTLIDASNDPVYPDLAFSYPVPIPQLAGGYGSGEGRLVVGVSPIAYCDPRVWPLKDERRYAAYLRLVTEVVKRLLKERHQVLFFATDGPDVETIHDIQAMISDSSIDSDAIRSLPGPSQLTTDGLLKGICRADLIIASRLHGVILSQLIATPALALSYDPKVDVHMSEIGQKEYCLHVDHVQAQTVIERLHALKQARSKEAVRLRAAGELLRQQLESQYDRLLGTKLSSPTMGDHPDEVLASPPSFQTN